jgi:hypothetical protein
MDHLKSFGAIDCGGDFIAVQFEKLDEEIEYFPVVVNDQYSAPV